MLKYGHYINGEWVDSQSGRTFTSRDPATGSVLAQFAEGVATDVSRAVEIANDVEYGLSSAIYTQNINTAHRAIQDLETGITYVNAPTIGAEVHLPFGGVKNTGNGAREAGTAAIEEFTETKTVFIDYSSRLQKAQIQD